MKVTACTWQLIIATFSGCRRSNGVGVQTVTYSATTNSVQFSNGWLWLIDNEFLSISRATRNSTNISSSGRHPNERGIRPGAITEAGVSDGDIRPEC